MKSLAALWMSAHWTLALTDTLLHFVWQGALIGVGTVAVLNGLRPARAATRYAVLCVALALLVAAPIATLVALVLAPSVSGAAAHVLVVRTALSLTLSRAPGVVLPLWVVGVCVCGVRVLVGYRYVVALRAGAQTAAGRVLDTVRTLEQRMHVRRRVQVLVAAVGGGPSMIGWLRPVLLIPAAVISGLTPEQLETIIAHEMAHVRRHDYLVNLVQLVVETLLFYHPVTWWLSARLREERELCCDDVVVETCGDAVVYARALAEAERRRVVLGGPIGVLGAGDGPLMYRIRRLLGLDAPRRRSPTMIPVLALLVACALVACVATAVDAPRLESRIGKPNPGENGEASFAATLLASRSVAAGAQAGSVGARLVSIQFSGVPPEIRDRMNLPVQIGDTIRTGTSAVVVSRLREVAAALHSTIVPVAPGRVALLISMEGR